MVLPQKYTKKDGVEWKEICEIESNVASFYLLMALFRQAAEIFFPQIHLVWFSLRFSLYSEQQNNVTNVQTWYTTYKYMVWDNI